MAFQWAKTGCAALLMAAVAGAAACANDLTHVRFGAHDDFSRVVIEADRPIEFDAFVLAEPTPRLVVSLPGAAWRVADLANGQGRGHGLFEEFRFDPSGHNPRVIFNLEGPARIVQEMTLDPAGGGYRMVVDIAPAPREEFVELAGFPERSQTLTQLLAEVADVTPDLGLCRRPRIVVDPGHGGRDPGALQRHGGGHEADVNLAAALELRALLNATGRFDVVLTRETDVFIELEDRVRIARAAQADMFISLHADAAGSHTARGAAVYVLSSQGVDRSRTRAQREGDWFLPESEHRPAEVNEILFDISMGDKLNRSRQFASELLAEVRTVSALLRDHPEHRGFLVLLDAQFPAVLFEMGFMSNPQDARNLNDANHRRRLMASIVAALEDHFPDCGARTNYAANSTAAPAR
ncbi:N-acetylmuramoyl-L-alanine amidase [Marinicauda algicola]|nr:N-acetylmuramoyl-L-alanine amidase [Marinicauda algicola]